MKILIVEDDELTRQGLSDLLESEGYLTDQAADGIQAINKFKNGSPDLVCLDVMMPGKNGYDTCREIRKINKTVPLLFLSAKSEEIDKVLGLELGADDYIVKPFGTHEIVARIKALLRRSGLGNGGENAESAKPFEMDDLKIIPSELRAYRGDKVIDLSRRELTILQILAANPGAAVTRDEIFDKAWGMNYLPESRTLDQAVSQLRKKIEIDPSNPKLIRTVHNAGYRWEP